VYRRPCGGVPSTNNPGKDGSDRKVIAFGANGLLLGITVDSEGIATAVADHDRRRFILYLLAARRIAFFRLCFGPLCSN